MCVYNIRFNESKHFLHCCNSIKEPLRTWLANYKIEQHAQLVCGSVSASPRLYFPFWSRIVQCVTIALASHLYDTDVCEPVPELLVAAWSMLISTEHSYIDYTGRPDYCSYVGLSSGFPQPSRSCIPGCILDLHTFYCVNNTNHNQSDTALGSVIRECFKCKLCILKQLLVIRRYLIETNKRIYFCKLDCILFCSVNFVIIFQSLFGVFFINPQHNIALSNLIALVSYAQTIQMLKESDTFDCHLFVWCNTWWLQVLAHRLHIETMFVKYYVQSLNCFCLIYSWFDFHNLIIAVVWMCVFLCIREMWDYIYNAFIS